MCGITLRCRRTGRVTALPPGSGSPGKICYCLPGRSASCTLSNPPLFTLHINRMVSDRFRGHFHEPVWRSCRNRNDFAFGQVAGNAAFNGRCAHPAVSAPQYTKTHKSRRNVRQPPGLSPCIDLTAAAITITHQIIACRARSRCGLDLSSCLKKPSRDFAGIQKSPLCSCLLGH